MQDNEVDSSYSCLTRCLHSFTDQLIPIKEINTTDSCPPFNKTLIRSLSRKRNNLIHKCQFNRANEISSKIGKLIAETRSESLSNVNPRSSKNL
jgi:hypothetical protein